MASCRKIINLLEPPYILSKRNIFINSYKGHSIDITKVSPSLLNKRFSYLIYIHTQILPTYINLYLKYYLK